MSGDLALIADRRAGLSALLGLLILEEPGTTLGPLVSDIPDLAPLATGGSATATAYERIFLRGVPLYESVFRAAEGQHDHSCLTMLVDDYERLGFAEHRDERWRVAGPDHLGLELRCLADLCRAEATAWRAGTPDVAMQVIDWERSFLADHLGVWAPVALEAARERARKSVYWPVLTAITDFLDEEFDRLRPAPDLGRDLRVEALPQHLGPARLTRMLLTPARSGTWLGTELIGVASHAAGLAWRPSDTRSALRHAIEQASDTGELPLVLGPLIEGLDFAAAKHRRAATTAPGNAANALRWAATADAMRARLVEIVEHGLNPDGEAMASEILTVSGPDAAAVADAIDEVVDTLRTKGLRVERRTIPGQKSGADPRPLGIEPVVAVGGGQPSGPKDGDPP